MLVNYNDTKNFVSEEEFLLIQDRNEKLLLQSLFNFTDQDISQLTTVEIETVNRCNNDCSFCPVNRKQDIRELKKMDEELFKKIIDDLASMGYSGHISLFSNNEPLLDNRIFDFLYYANEKLPNATHVLFTNGILLDKNKYKKLVSYLDYLVIDNYNDDIVINENINTIKNDESIKDERCKVDVFVRRKNQILNTRGGLSPNKNQIYHFSSPCILPFIQMVIRPDGKVSRCCQDAYGHETMGDLTYQSIQQVWNGKKYSQYRQIMKDNRRNDVMSCGSCDVFGLVNYFPKQWLSAYISRLIKILLDKRVEGRHIILINIEKADYLVNLLAMNEVFVNEIAFEHDMENLVKESNFLVLDSYDWEVIRQLLSLGKKVGEDFIIFRDYYYDISFVPKEIFGAERKKVLNASENNNLIIFGAGMMARKLIDSLHLKPRVIIDNDLAKQGTSFVGVPVMALNDAGLDFTKVCILVAVGSNYVPIVKQLNSLGINNIVLGINVI